MKRVARSEGALLQIVQALFEPWQASRVRRQVQVGLGEPERLGPTAADLLRTTLARGVLRDLLRAGGWRRMTTLRAGDGRLWERHPALRLDFSAQTAAMLLAVTRHTPGAVDVRFIDPTPADRWTRALLADLLIALNQPLPRALFADAPLCWLLCTPGMAAAFEVPADLDFTPLVTGPMAVWLEAAQPRLIQRWIQQERRKPTIRSAAIMTRIGTAQRRALDGLFAAADGAERRDLCGFAVHAAQAILAPNPPARWWIEALDTQGALSVRQAATTAAAGLLSALATPARWHAEHGRARIFDDGYDDARFLLARWEAMGRAGFATAARLSRELSDLPGRQPVEEAS